MVWGFAPLIVTGMIAGLVPGRAAGIAALGALLMVGLTTYLAIQALRSKRANQRRYEAAAAEARATGMLVRVTTTESGDYEYTLDAPPKVEKLEWPPRE
jgi:hypothetical protein